MTNGSKVNITGKLNWAANNSAVYGGFAYMRDNGTELRLAPSAVLSYLKT